MVPPCSATLARRRGPRRRHLQIYTRNFAQLSSSRACGEVMVATGQRAGTVMQAPSNDNSIDALAMASDRSHASGLMNTQAEPCLADVTQAVAGVVRIVELMLARGMGGTLRCIAPEERAILRSEEH